MDFLIASLSVACGILLGGVAVLVVVAVLCWLVGEESEEESEPPTLLKLYVEELDKPA